MKNLDISEKNSVLFKIVLGIAILLLSVRVIGSSFLFKNSSLEGAHVVPAATAHGSEQKKAGSQNSTQGGPVSGERVSKDLQHVPDFTSPRNLYHGYVSDDHLSYALSDTGHRVASSFAVPGILRTSVEFWLKIYTRYSSLQAVFFDSNTMEIYEELDFRKIAKAARNQMAYEITVENLIKKKLALYQTAFALLNKKKSSVRSLSLSDEEKNILELRKKTRLQISQLSPSIRLMKGQRDNIIKGLTSVETFNPKMEAIFSYFKVPVELTRLSLVESSFNLNARSKVGAAGVWQFMESSGKSYLTIDAELGMDERLSPLKATAAAAKMLYWNYKYLGSWPLAVISYNHGLRSLPRLKVGSNDFSQIEGLFENPVSSLSDDQKKHQSRHKQKKAALGWASRNYYSEFLAVLYAEKYRDLFYGEAPVAYIRPVSFSQLEKAQSAYSLAIEKGISIQDFRLFNADIEDIHQTLPQGYWVVAPSQGEDLKGLKEYTVRSLKRIHWDRKTPVVAHSAPKTRGHHGAASHQDQSKKHHAGRSEKRSLAFSP